MNRREAIQRTGLVLGYAVSASALAGILNGCKAAPELTYKPVFFSEDQARLVSEIAQTYIPLTDTPGAKEAGVPGFIDQILRECYNKEDQDRFTAGLQAFDEDVKKDGSSFFDLETSKREEYLLKAQTSAMEITKNDPKAPKPFILMCKELTLLGFFTSEPGATQVLQYEAVPGAYHGCVPLKEVGKTWATS